MSKNSVFSEVLNVAGREQVLVQNYQVHTDNKNLVLKPTIKLDKQDYMDMAFKLKQGMVLSNMVY